MLALLGAKCCFTSQLHWPQNHSHAQTLHLLPGAIHSWDCHLRLKTKATRKEKTTEMSSAHVQLLLGPKPEAGHVSSSNQFWCLQF